MKNLSNVIRSRAARFVSLRVVLILSAVMVFAGFSVASALNGGFDWLSIRTASAESKVAATAPTASAPLAPGTCDTAGPIEVESSTGTAGGTPTAYASLGAAFTAINGGVVHTGVITIDVCGDTAEGTATATLLAGNDAATADYTSITMSPAGGAARTISGATTAGAPLIDFSGADNVTINGLNTGGNTLTIANTTVSATSITSTIRFIGGATNNTITNSNIQGSGTMSVATNGAIIFFSTDAVTTGGNDNNTISNNNIGPAGANLPTKGILCNGSTTSQAIGNSGLIIDNNNIFDFFGAAVTSAGVAVNGGCNTFSITNNRLYQTATRTETTAALHTPILMNSSTSTSGVQGMTITGNTIGYASNTQTGTYTLTGAVAMTFRGISFTGITLGTSSTISSNTIANISMTGVTSSGTSSGSPMMGIYVSNGVVTANSNTIGSQGATGSITYSSSSASTSDVNAMFNFGVDNWTTNSNNIGGITASNSSTGASNIYGLRVNTGSTVTWTCNNNTIGGTVANSIQSTTTSASSIVTGILNSNPIGTITGNTIRNLTTAGGTGTGSSASVGGIVVTSSAAQTISQNTLNTFSATGASTVIGITSTGTSLTTMSKNKIYDLQSNNAGGIVNGIQVGLSSTTFTVANNLIGDLRTPATSSAASAIIGINLTSTSTSSTINVFHNTIYINGTSSGANFSTTGIFHTASSTATTAALNLRNNIIVNSSTPAGTGLTVAYRRSAGTAGTLANYASTSNNNDFYAGTPGAANLIYSDGTSTAMTMAAYKAGVFTAGTIAPRDSASFSEDPEFQSTVGANANFLKYKVTSAKQVENGGANIAGITDDFFGTIRAGNGGYGGTGTAPDVGAWELEGIAADLTAPVISYTLLGNGAAVATRAFSNVTVTDGTGVNTTAGTRPRVYYKKTSDANNTFNDNTSGTVGFKFVEATGGGGSPFSFTIDYSLLFGGGGVTVGDTIQYFVVAQDTVTPTPNVGINSGTFNATPTSVALTAAAFPIGGTINTYNIVTGYSGTLTVDAGGAITSITNAGGLFATLNAGVLTGNLTVNITSDLVAETGANQLNQLSEDPVGNFTVTIKPSGAARTISGSFASGLITLNGADRVVFDGTTTSFAPDELSPEAAGDNLTITNTNTGTSSAVIWVQTATGSNGATNNIFKNLNINGNAGTTTLVGIGFGGTTISTSSLGTGNNTNTVESCDIRAAQFGIYSQGASAASKNTGNVFTQNTMSAASPNNISKGGIQVGFENSIQITQNTIDGVTQASSPDVFGIALGLTGISTTSFTGNEVTNATVSRNFIGKVTNTGTFSAVGISVASATSGTNAITNNSIYGVGANGTSGDFGAGIFLGGGVGSTTQVYFNSVSMTGTFTGGSYPNYGLAIGGTDPVVDARNNAFFNTLVNGTGVSFAIGTASSTFANLTSNYNDHFVTAGGGTFKIGKTGSLSQGTGTEQLLLSDWITATGKDTPNSISANPTFNSLTNLQPQTGSPLLLAGVTGTGVTIDITGAARGATPTIGAYETAIDTAGPVITYTALGNTTSTSNRTLTISVTDASGVPTSGTGLPRIYFRKGISDPFTPTSQCSFVSGSSYNCLVDYTQVTGGSVTTGDTVQYYVVAQDTIGNVSANPSAGAGGFTANPPAAATPPTTPNSYLIAVGYTGSYSVPGAFASLTNTGGIFEAINAGVLTGNVTINISSDLAGELGTVALNQWAEEGAGNYTLLIKPSGAPRMITGTNASGVIKLNGADRVRIDGSTAAMFAEGRDEETVNDLVGGNPAIRQLTITNSSATGAAIWIATNATSGANNNTIRNLNIVGPGGFGGQGIIAGSGTTFATAAENGRPNSNNTVNNNSCKGVQNCVFAAGDPTTRDDSWMITENDFGSAMAAEKLSFRGIFLGGSQNFTIRENRISGISSSTGTTSTMSGIMLGGVISIGSITRNEIKDIRQTNTGGWGSNGLYLASTSATANVLIANNMISDIASQGFAGNEPADNGYGIVVESTGAGYIIAHNTVVMNGNQVAAGSITAALLIDDSAITVGAVDLRNNILANTQAVGTQYSVYVDTPVTSMVFPTINFNDYFSVENVGILGGTIRTTVADWMTATGQDAMSQNIDPMFVSATDFHLNGATTPLLGDGTALGSVTIDFDTDPRPASSPDIGADEVVQSEGGIMAGGAYYNAILAGGDTMSGNVLVTNSLTLTGISNTGAGNVLVIGCNATVNGASDTNYVSGDVQKDFCAPGSFTYPVGDPAANSVAPTNGYMPVNVTITALVNPSSLIVNANNGLVPPLNAATTLSAYWTLTEVGDLTANLSFNYNQGDVNGNEAVYRVIRVEGGNAINYPTTVLDATNNIASVTNITNFSDWTVGEPFAPTNVEANIAGHVVNSTGGPLAGVTMTLLDTILVQSRTTVTDTNGNYFFNAILTGRQIVVTPAKNGYTFDPSNRAFNHTGELTNVNFTGTESGQTRSIGSDFDGDGKADLSVFRPGDATWYTLLSSTNTVKAEQWGLGTDRIAPADYDGDHVTDIAVFRPSTGSWYIKQSSTSTLRAVNWGLAEDVITPADFDGDGQDDIAVWRPSTGTWYVIKSTNGQTLTVNWGTNGDRPVAADYDGDGKADMAVWRPSNGTWYVLKSSDASYQYEHWGIEEDRPIVGDFDGDRKSDLAVFRPTTATWYVKFSSDATTNYRGHGTAGDILTPGDYDGDGLTDRAVWQVGGDWNILRSTTNAPFTQHWGQTGDIPTTSAYVR